MHDDKIKAGDAVLLKRGDIFRGNLVSAKSGVSYGAYGEGDKPCIYGCKKNYAEEVWCRTEIKNIYSLVVDINSDIGMIIFNHGEEYGFKMLESVSECTEDYDFYHDKTAGVLYLYCSQGRPTDLFYDIELLYNIPGIHVANDASNVYIENISVKYVGGHGISVGRRVDGITIKNCEIGWIGGAIFRNETERYGNGIQFYGQTTNSSVENCWIYQCYDAGLTHQYSSTTVKESAENIIYSNNLVEFCTYSFEYFWGFEDESGNHIDDTAVSMKNIIVSDNIMRFAGYGIGQVRPKSWNVGHVVTWGSHYNPSENFVFKNNIFDTSTLNIFAMYTLDTANPTLNGNTYVQTSGGKLGTYSIESLNTNDFVTLSLDQVSLNTVDATGKLIIVE